VRTLIVIPARDEAALIGRCLQSVAAALRPDCRVVVVADSCVDGTAAIARGFGGVEVIEVSYGNVGAARAAGVAYGLPDADWIASTDADSVVPANWIDDQRRLALRGADVIVGTVRPVTADLDERQRAAWTARHDPQRPNGHVHGANLGMRVSSYLDAGGFLPLAEHEDTDLVARLAERGAVIVAANSAEVTTSGRSFGRTPGGYARYLRSDLVDVTDEAIA